MNATTLVLAICSLLGFAAGISAHENPSIIVILTDDQGYGDVGRPGHPLLKTPNMLACMRRTDDPQTMPFEAATAKR